MPWCRQAVSANRLLTSWGGLSKSCRPATVVFSGVRGFIGSSQNAGLATVAAFGSLVPKLVAQRMGAQTVGKSMRFLSLSAAGAFGRPAGRLSVASGGLWRTGPTAEVAACSCDVLASRCL